MTAYYNEIDPHAAGWIRNLISAGHVSTGTLDTTDIRYVSGDAVRHFQRCHFFAGIAGWELALQLAGWPSDRPVWTGSCPCQPYSSAGKSKGDDDPRNLWPEFRRLIAECLPATVFGEQVASKAGRQWFSGVRADLEAMGYAVGGADLCAACVGAPHIRQRLYWVAHTGHVGAGSGYGRPHEYATPERMLSGADDPAGGMVGRMADAPIDRLDQQCRDAGSQVGPGEPGRDEPVYRSGVIGMGDAFGVRLDQYEHPRDMGRETGKEPKHGREDGREGPERSSSTLGLGHTIGPGSQGCRTGVRGEPGDRGVREPAPETGGSFWDDFDVVPCRDGKARRVESGVQPLAHGVPGRVGLLRGYGNAIVPQVAAEFVKAFLEVFNP